MERVASAMHVSVSVLTWWCGLLILFVPGWFLMATLGARMEFVSADYGHAVMIGEHGVTVLFTSVVSGVLGLVAILVHRLLSGKFFGVIATPVWALAIGVIGLGWMTYLLDVEGEVPFLIDVTTDMTDPPGFTTSFVDRRVASDQSLEYAGKQDPDGRSYAELQLEYYPHLATLVLEAPASDVYRQALMTARDLGWHVGAASDRAGMFEATSETFWFGYRDDMIVRVRSDDAGRAHLDVRSLSRAQIHDLGRNARHVEEFLDAMEVAPGYSAATGSE